MILISLAELDDVTELHKLQENVWKEKDLFGIYSIAIYIRYGKVIIAKETGNNKIIGAVYTLLTNDTRYTYIADLFIDDNWQKRGIATKIYEELFTLSDKPIITQINIGNKGSIALHEKMGFKKIEEIERFYRFIPNEELSYMYLKEL